MRGGVHGKKRYSKYYSSLTQLYKPTCSSNYVENFVCVFDHGCESDSGLCGLIGVCPFTKGKAVSPKEFAEKGDF